MGVERRQKRQYQQMMLKLHKREQRKFADMTPEQIIKHIENVNARYKPNQETDSSVEVTDGQQD